MESIGKSMTELQTLYQMRNALLDCYGTAIRTMAQYAVEIDDEVTPAHRQHLTLIASDLVKPDTEALAASRSLLRNELRDYRDRAAVFLNALRSELAARPRLCRPSSKPWPPPMAIRKSSFRRP